MNRNKTGVVIVGGGPAGLTAAYELARLGEFSTVVERDNIVGGLSRTVEYKGYRFDIGGHRFYTKVALVEKVWREILGDNLLTRPRLSRIYYRGKFFNYPLSAMQALAKLGLGEAIRCTVSYLEARLRPRLPEEDLETWVSNRFGRRLFEVFFQTYTEKVWGMKCSEIQADWAAQRITGLTLSSLLRDALLPKRMAGSKIKTLINEFLYPRFGPGMMWETMAARLEEQGSRVLLETPVERINWQGGQVRSVDTGKGSFQTSHLISSMPIRSLIQILDPAPPAWLKSAVDTLRYRDFLTVALMIRRPRVFDDNWIYIHEPRVRVGRIQNFKNWSPEMVPDSAMTCLGMEYFCQQDDDLWSMSDRDLIELASRELGALGLADPADVVDGSVVRVPKAYPVYDDHYHLALEKVREFLRQVPNLQLVGRNGMHRYNNQDHSMLTGILAARNIMGAKYDLWRVNVDADFLEEGYVITEADLLAMEESQPLVPQELVTESTKQGGVIGSALGEL
ncbi:MAG: NAD(P)/FAD-dependent oxidoreductase [Acidobacteriia bacterium]|nr:NAD(P)/FAD-dependent oxidoreductase [Terriglobia bacterium]